MVFCSSPALPGSLLSPDSCSSCSPLGLPDPSTGHSPASEHPPFLSFVTLHLLTRSLFTVHGGVAVSPALCPQCPELSGDCCIAFYTGAYYSPSASPVSFSPALLSTQTPPGPVQPEEKLLSPTTVQQDTEAEKQMIREVRPQRAADMKERVTQGELVPVGCHPASLRGLGTMVPTSFLRKLSSKTFPKL